MIERLAHTTSVDEVLEPLAAGAKSFNSYIPKIVRAAQEGGNAVNPRERTYTHWGEREEVSTHLQFEI